MAINYTAIGAALKALLVAGNITGVKNVYQEAMDRDLLLDNMSLINVRLAEASWQERSLPNGYYAFLGFEVDVAAYDFTSFVEAATLRDSILDAAMLRVQANSRFHNDVNASRLGNIKFSQLAAQGAGGHVACATFAVIAEVYVEASA